MTDDLLRIVPKLPGKLGIEARDPPRDVNSNGAGRNGIEKCLDGQMQASQICLDGTALAARTDAITHGLPPPDALMARRVRWQCHSVLDGSQATEDCLPNFWSARTHVGQRAEPVWTIADYGAV